MMKRFSIFFLVMLCLATSQSNTLNIPSPENPTIQSAINNAANGDTIIVQPGTYRENINFLGKAITLTSQNPNDPNIITVTIIDGNGPADSNNGSVVTFNSGEKNDSVLSGFTITGGTGSWLPVSWQYKRLNWNRCGGGVICYNMSQPTIKNNIFSNNTAGQGGGIYVYGDPVDPNNPAPPPVRVRPFITGNTFINNRALISHGFQPPDSNYPCNDHGDGGAIACFQGCDAVITGNTIQNNIAYYYGGGVHLRQWSNGLIQNNHIFNNKASLGGGIHTTYTSSPTITENIIENNTAGGFGGGGIYVYDYSKPLITYNVILQNTSNGGPGGGIGVFWDSNPTIQFNLIAKNNAGKGGGIYTNSGTFSILYNTIADNSAQTGSGICLEFTASINVTGNIVASNTGSAQIYAADTAATAAAYNCFWSEDNDIYGGSLESLTEVNDNISEDPKFVSADSNDYSLNVYSPCINAGDPNYVKVSNQKDINGDDRIMGQYIDIGADEAWPVWNITKGTGYITIQQAIDNSNNYDNVVVGRGRYYENIDFGTHQLVLSSADANNWETIEKTIIDANQSGTAVTIAGGQDANTIIRGLTITNGAADNENGGGIACNASVVIEKNLIINNSSTLSGGGLYFSLNSITPIVKGNKIISNHSYYGGGIYCDTTSMATITGNYFWGNEADYTGGAISCAYQAYNTYVGGNLFIFNKAPIGGAITSEQASAKLFIEGNFFGGNMATSEGGAMAFAQTDPNIVNNTFISNRSTDTGGTTAGIISIESDSNPLIANNIIANSDYGFGIYSVDDANYSPCYPTILNNNVYDCHAGKYGGGITNQTGVNGNISVDPNIVHPGWWVDNNTPDNPDDDYYSIGNYHIMPDSPCVNAGSNSSVPAWLVLDCDNETRIAEETVDIGADEAVKNPCDLNNDGIVDSYELNILAGEWLLSGTGLQTDFHKDNFIDFLDLASLADQWFWMGGWYQEVKMTKIPHTESPDGNSFDSYENCVAHWKFDESAGTIASEQISAGVGTLNNFPADNSQWISGQINNGLDFDGTNDYVSTNFEFLKTADDFTIAFWFRAEATSFCRLMIWQGDSTANGWGGNQEMHISLGNQTTGQLNENDKLAFYMGSNIITSGKALHISTGFSDTSSWHFVAVTVQDLSSAPSAEMYLDGVSVGTSTMNASDLSRSGWNTGLRFGRPGTSERFFNGRLDNVLVYNKSLSEAEINELYDAAK
jgi:parallel beta-helix repeat protein